MPIQPHPSLSVHPGDWLKSELIEANGLSITDAARMLRVARETLSRLVNSRTSLSPAMARRFERVFCIPADTMIRMQARWDALRTDGDNGD